MSATGETRPNMLLLLTDQERYDLTSPDGRDVQTPALDRLASGGMRFQRAYTPTSICSPARASILTGKFPHDHGILNNCHADDAVRPNLDVDEPSFSRCLSEQGYETSYVGKWHASRDLTPADFGFDYMGDPLDQAAFREYQRSHGVAPEEDDATVFGFEEVEDAIYLEYDHNRTLLSAKTTIPPEATYPYYMASRTIERLEALAEGDGPFFHRLDFRGPHYPYVVPEPYASMYDPEEIEPWGSYEETFEGKPQVHSEHVNYRLPQDLDWVDWAEATAKYFGFMTFLDDQIGRVLDALDDLSVAEETVVVHSSDHGDFCGAHRQFNKGPLMYEDTYRVPLQVRWPGVTEAGSVCEAPVSLVDLFPTFAEMAGASPPEEIHGRSLVPLLAGEDPDDWREVVFAEYHGDEFGLYSQRMVVGDRYKFVFNYPDVNELYDLDADPHELDNRIDDPAYEDVRADLAEALEARMRETDDPFANWGTEIVDV